MSEVFSHCFELLQIDEFNTVAYHPDSNGALERMHKAVVEFVRYFVDRTREVYAVCHSHSSYTNLQLMNYCLEEYIMFSAYYKEPQSFYNYNDVMKEIRQEFKGSRRKPEDIYKNQADKNG